MNDIESKGTHSKGGTGRKPMSDEAEVTGHGSGRQMVICPQCGALNYVESDWQWFTCWQCGFTTAPGVRND